MAKDEEKRSKRASCKIDIDIYEKMKEISEKKNMSVYKYMNEVLSFIIDMELMYNKSVTEVKDYLDFYSKMEKMDTILVPIEFLSKHEAEECYKYGVLLSSINYEIKSDKGKMILFLFRLLQSFRPNRTNDGFYIIFHSLQNSSKECLKGIVKGFFESLDLKEHEDFEIEVKPAYMGIKVK